MQNDVTICTCDDDLDIKYGMINFGEERELARASVRYILSDMNDIRKSFIRLGFHLSEMQDMKYYEDFGYCSLEEFAEANLGMDKSNVYRYIRVYENFCQSESTFAMGLEHKSCSMELNDRWKNFSFSQLVEMCNMSEDQRKRCLPDMTIKQIREIKKATKIDFAALDKAIQDNEKVAMSPQVNNLCVKDLADLHGAALSSKFKSVESVDVKHVTMCDNEGKIICSALTCDILLNGENQIVLRVVPGDVNKNCWKMKEG